jgi:hypothetical protein
MSSIQRWYDAVKSGGAGLAKAKSHAMAAGAGVRQGGEALLVGGLLGAMSVELPTGLDVKKVPVDAVGGVAFLVASAAVAGEEYSTDLRNAGSTALAVFAYRKTQDLLAEKKRAGGGMPGYAAAKTVSAHGDYDYSGGTSDSDMGEDPIVTAARLL